MKKVLSVILCLLMLLSVPAPVLAASALTVDEVLLDVADYIYNLVREPQVGSVGGEWTVLGLARSGLEIPEAYFQCYYENVEAYVQACGGVLHTRKYTEYSRVIVALTAIGKNPADVAGYDLLTPLGDYDKTVWQGLNGPIWALLALDCGNYAMPQNPEAATQATREMYIDRILECQLPDGGWSLFGGTAAAEAGDQISDPDITGMALQALARYKERAAVQSAIDKALRCMSEKQSADGGFASWGTDNVESCVQVLAALCTLGISYEDTRFVKNGNTILDNILLYYEKDNGFKHTMHGGANLMATEQAFYGLVALSRLQNGKSPLYQMDDTVAVPEMTPPSVGLAGKHADVQKREIQAADKTFADILAHPSRLAIEALAARGIISGRTESIFAPDATMTRAEFATILVNGLGLPKQGKAVFADVTAADWFYDYVGSAYSYGIVKGVSESEFSPNGTITRQAAAVMVARAAQLCGIKTEMETFAVRDVLAGFTDYVQAASWAQGALAFCYATQILPDTAMEIQPQAAVTRAEIAQMLYNTLCLAGLM